MSTSTDAIMAFGFDLGEELPEGLMTSIELSDGEEHETFEWDEFVANQLLPDLAEPAHDDYNKDWPKYWQKRRKAVEAFPLDMIMHCSLECPMWFLAIRGTEQRVNRGYVEPVKQVAVTGEQIAALKAFCEKYGIEWQEPAWHIMSYWG
jgi:hypothetical protein